MHSNVFFGRGGGYEAYPYFCWGVRNFWGIVLGVPNFVEIFSNTLHSHNILYDHSLNIFFDFHSQWGLLIVWNKKEEDGK